MCLKVFSILLVVFHLQSAYLTEAAFENGRVYKICASDDKCLSAFDEGVGPLIGKVTIEEYRGAPEQKWKGTAQFQTEFSTLENLGTGRSSYFNDITLFQAGVYAVQYYWKITQKATNSYILEAYYSSDSHRGCLQYMGKNQGFQILPCSDTDQNQRWKLILV